MEVTRLMDTPLLLSRFRLFDMSLSSYTFAPLAQQKNRGELHNMDKTYNPRHRTTLVSKLGRQQLF